MVATRRNEVIEAFYARRVAVGKAKKAALTACMRKLLTMLNAMARSETPWSLALAKAQGEVTRAVGSSVLSRSLSRPRG